MASILIIDDDEITRVILATMLGQLGHTVTEAAGGAKGVNLCSTCNFDLIFTDLIMPDRDGIEVIREIRQASSTVGIVAMSGEDITARTTNLRMARLLGANCVMQKPFTGPELTRILDESLAGTGRQNRESKGPQ